MRRSGRLIFDMRRQLLGSGISGGGLVLTLCCLTDSVARRIQAYVP